MKIPAKSPDVGELSVLNDDVEYTVCVGRIYHRHFEVDRDAVDDAAAVAHEVISWIEDILTDEIRLRHYFIEERLAGASSWRAEVGAPATWLKTATRYEDFCWSGPLGAGQPTAD